MNAEPDTQEAQQYLSATLPEKKEKRVNFIQPNTFLQYGALGLLGLFMWQSNAVTVQIDKELTETRLEMRTAIVQVTRIAEALERKDDKFTIAVNQLSVAVAKLEKVK